MQFQLSAILSLTVLAVSTMAQFPFPTPGVTLTFTDGSTKHFDFNECIPVPVDPTGALIVTAVFSEPATCNLFAEPFCQGPSLPLAFPSEFPVPNPFFVAGTIINSAQCFPL